MQILKICDGGILQFGVRSFWRLSKEENYIVKTRFLSILRRHGCWGTKQDDVSFPQKKLFPVRMAPIISFRNGVVVKYEKEHSVMYPGPHKVDTNYITEKGAWDHPNFWREGAAGSWTSTWFTEAKDHIWCMNWGLPRRAHKKFLRTVRFPCSSTKFPFTHTPTPMSKVLEAKDERMSDQSSPHIPQKLEPE
jgi:hypothetical protein